MARELQDTLGQKLVAYAIGDRHPKSVGRYARGERHPEDAALARLIDLYILWGVLKQGSLTPGAAKMWMLGANPILGRAPSEAFHEGQASQVIGAAKAFVSMR